MIKKETAERESEIGRLMNRDRCREKDKRNQIIWAGPWSRGYGRRLTFERLRVQFPAMDGHFYIRYIVV